VTPEAQKKISNEKNFTFLRDQAKAPGGLEKLLDLINDPKIAKMYKSLVKFKDL
jgi:hypothetical protein